MSSNASFQERFESKVMLIPESTCHWWAASSGGNGYGQFRQGARMVRAHRLAYEMYIGEIPEGMQVLHACDNRACVNPSHFFLGTNKDNIDDKVSKGRQSRGESSGRTGLTAADVVAIRIRSKTETITSIAKSVGMHPTSVGEIVRGTTWKHIKC